MRARVLLPLLLLAYSVAGTGCGRRPVRSVVGEPPSACEDIAFRGRYKAADSRARRLHASARVCRAGPLQFEIRGRVGGAVLAGAVGNGRLLLLLPRERRAILGPDDPEVWRAWTGLALSEAILRSLLEDARKAPQAIGGWQIVVPHDTGPRGAVVTALSDRGERLEVQLLRRKPAVAPARWPEVPESFVSIEVSSEHPRGVGGGA